MHPCLLRLTDSSFIINLTFHEGKPFPLKVVLVLFTASILFVTLKTSGTVFSLPYHNEFLSASEEITNEVNLCITSMTALHPLVISYTPTLEALTTLQHVNICACDPWTSGSVYFRNIGCYEGIVVSWLPWVAGGSFMFINTSECMIISCLYNSLSPSIVFFNMKSLCQGFSTSKTWENIKIGRRAQSMAFKCFFFPFFHFQKFCFEISKNTLLYFIN